MILMQPLIMILAPEHGANAFVDEFNEHHYRTWVSTTIGQALLDIGTIQPDLLFIIDHFIEGFRDPLEVYFYLRHHLQRVIPVVIMGERHVRKNLIHLDLTVFRLIEQYEVIDYIYQILPLKTSSE